MEIIFKAVMEKPSWVPKQCNMFNAKADAQSFCQQSVIPALGAGRHVVLSDGRAREKRTFQSVEELKRFNL